MKLQEIFDSKAKKKKSDCYEFIVDKWDGHEPDGFYFEPFDVKVEYYAERPSHSDHPYQDGKAREYHPGSLSIESITTVKSVKMFNSDTDKVEKEFPAGTSLKKMPGWDKASEAWFDNKAEENFESD
jgi:hypothetical protein